MSEEKLLTVRDVSIQLGISEKDVLDLAERGEIPAYKVGGVYLRFKKEQVDQYEKTHHDLQQKSRGKDTSTLQERLYDFFYFNDFYILAAGLIALLGYLVYRGF